MKRCDFSKYPNKYFVESGTYAGGGIYDALKAGFNQIFSMEISDFFYNLCKDLFKHNENVHLHLGSSVNLLKSIIDPINEPITFWLDGHYCCGLSGYDKNYVCPLLQELDIIKQHSIKTHTIIIDDKRLFKKSADNGLDGFFMITEDEVLEKIKDINPSYEITYEDGIVPNDIIVARINKMF